MVKTLFVYCAIFFTLFLLSLTLHKNYIDDKGFVLSFSLVKVYLFHLVFSLLICINFKLLSTVNKIYNQLGFIYFAVLTIKIILFCVIFYQSVFTIVKLPNIARISLVIPMILFLSVEVFFIVKILNKNPPK